MEAENLNLTEKQEKYCQAYVITGNQATAYRMAYDAEAMNQNTVYVKASELHSSGNISVRIKQIQKEAYERNKITIDELIQTMAGMVRFDISDLYNENGSLKSIHDMPKEARQMISELTSFDEFENDGAGGKILVGYTKKVKTIDKLQAIEKLMKHLGGYEVDNNQKSKMVLDTSTLSTEELVKRAEALKVINGKA